MFECEDDAEYVELRKCEGGDLPYICKREMSLCVDRVLGGEVIINVGKVDCGNKADVTIEVKGGKEFDAKEKIYITFWERGFPLPCVDEAISYTDLIAKCYGDFLGEYTIELDLLEGA